MKTTVPHRRAGFTLVEIMIVVAIIGMLAAIAIPNIIKARENSTANACIYNLRRIDSAVQQFSMEAGKKAGDTLTEDDIKPYIKLTTAGDIPGCPANGNYTLAVVGIIPSVECSLGSTVDPVHILP